jgi:hypothetical protein
MMFAIMIVLFAGVVAFAFWLFSAVTKATLKSKEESWEGEVIDKGIQEATWYDSNKNPYVAHDYYLKVKLPDGRVKQVSVEVKFYYEVEVGDRIMKEKGSLTPKKIS